MGRYEMDISEKIAFSSQTYQEVIKRLGIIGTFKGNWQAIESSEGRHLKELRKIATIASIGSSTRIEGATLTDEEVERLLKSVKITKLETREEQAVVGYYEALKVILENYADVELTESYIHQLHGILRKHSDKDQNHQGGYKKAFNQVVASYPDGTQHIILELQSFT